eukprot:SAG31_NODE_8125_length_1517_cov_0.908322_2_plen_278_part_00
MPADERVFSFSYDRDRWEVATEPLHNDGPIARSNGTKGAGLAMSFARVLLDSGRVRNIGFVPCAYGGAPISRWVPSDSDGAERVDIYDGNAQGIASNPGLAGDLYARATRRLRLALGTAKSELGSQAGGEPVFAGVLWHQGETDTAKYEDACSIPHKLRSIIAAFRGENLCQEKFRDVPCIIGELGNFVNEQLAASRTAPENNGLYANAIPYGLHAKLVNEGLAEVARSTSGVALVSAAKLLDCGDSLHFDGASLRELGKRYAAAWLGLADQEIWTG